MKERITPKDDIEIYNAVTNENTDKTQVLKWALCGKDYEDLEEQGLIVRLPCKVGDKVYIAGQYGMYVSEFILSKMKIFIERDSVLINYFAESTTDIFSETSFWFTHNFIGEFVFLTREEAEKKLKELKENERL